MSDKHRITAYILSVFRRFCKTIVPNRIAAGFLRLFGEKLGISSKFSYKTIERGYDPGRSKKLLDEVHRIMNLSGNSEENIFSTDGTGDPATMKVNYESKRSLQRTERGQRKDHGKEKSDAFPSTKGRHDFQYSVLAAGVHTKMIAGFSTTDDHSIGELSHFPHIMSQTIEMCPQMNEMLGDALYANRNVCSITQSNGIDQYFLSKTNASLRANGVESLKSMLYYFMDDTQSWLEHHHIRSISECVDSTMNRKMPTKIRKKVPRGRRRRKP